MPDELEASLKSAIETDPSNLSKYFELAELMIEKNRAEEAI